MATELDFVNQVRSALAGLTPSLATQAGSDYRRDLDDLASGNTVYRLRHQQEQSVNDSNQEIQGVSLEIEISHHLANRYNERAYTEGDMLATMASIFTKSFWRVAAVREIISAPVEGIDVAREGNIIHWSVVVIVALVP